MYSVKLGGVPHALCDHVLSLLYLLSLLVDDLVELRELLVNGYVSLLIFFFYIFEEFLHIPLYIQ